MSAAASSINARSPARGTAPWCRRCRLPCHADRLAQAQPSRRDPRGPSGSAAWSSATDADHNFLLVARCSHAPSAVATTSLGGALHEDVDLARQVVVDRGILDGLERALSRRHVHPRPLGRALSRAHRGAPARRGLVSRRSAAHLGDRIPRRRATNRRALARRALQRRARRCATTSITLEVLRQPRPCDP